MAAGDVKLVYGTSTDLTVTNLAGLASSATWVAGWESNVIDNTSNLYLDYLLSGRIQVHDDAASAAGSQIRIYVVSMISDTEYPDVFDGTESAETWTDALMMGPSAKLAAVITPATTQNLVYPFGQLSVANLFGGVCPPKFVIFISHNTGVNLHTSGQVVTVQGVYNNVAAS
jgi:hypothetical protein